jgi:hypothetical protein
MSIPLSLKARLGPRVRVLAGSRVHSGSPARYLLRADPSFTKTISAAWELAKRHVAPLVAKRAVERLVENREVAIDLPVLEDAGLFEGEMAALGVQAIKYVEATQDTTATA